MNPPRATHGAGTARVAVLRLPVVVAALVALASCGPSEPEDLIDRDAFVDAYVELRVAALDTDSQRVAASERDSILDRLGITGDDLLRFVEFHGGDLEFMRDVWNDVELRLDRPPRPTPAEEADGSDGPGESEDVEGSGEADDVQGSADGDGSGDVDSSGEPDGAGQPA